MTKREMERQAYAHFEQYENSEMESLRDAYVTGGSVRKEYAWESCKNLCKDHDGQHLRVISKNTFMFTAGFMFVKEENGEQIPMFMYITPNYSVAVEI